MVVAVGDDVWDNAAVGEGAAVVVVTIAVGVAVVTVDVVPCAELHPATSSALAPATRSGNPRRLT